MDNLSIFDAACRYCSLGRCVIPSGGGSDGKAALVPWKIYQITAPAEGQLQKWQQELKPPIWAMVTGPVSGVFAIDGDSPEANFLMAASGIRPHVKTKKGYHYYCSYPKWPVANSVRLLPGLDIRGQGGYVNFAGTNGKAQYEVLIWPTQDSLYMFEQLPQELRKVLQPKPSTFLERILSQARDRARLGNRNETGLWLACQLRDNGISESDAKPVMGQYVSAISSLGGEPYTENEAFASMHQAFSRPARQGWHVIDGTLPEIIVANRPLREKSNDTMAAVEQANNPPQLFERAGHLVRIVKDENGAPYIEQLSESAFRGFMDRSANYVHVTNKSEKIPLSAPPLEIVRDCMSLPHRNLPPLLNVTEIPVVRSDGTIVDSPGYDPITKLYYEPAKGLVVPNVPDVPTQSDLRSAVALLNEIVSDFPFDTTASHANGIGAMVTPIYRPMISGVTPMCLLDKPQAGTGASLYGEVISTIATDRAAMMTAPATDEEWEKKLTSVLRRGRSVIIIDNVEGNLYSPSLAMFLTSNNINARILGQTEDIILPNRATYICTGNNVRLAGDLPRRCYLCRMDALEAKPWTRDPTRFKHPNLIQWVKQNRGAIIAAIMTLARAWVTAGRPAVNNLPNLGGFEEWTYIVGNILNDAEIEGFLENLDTMYAKSDVDSAQWESFLATWHDDVFKEENVTVSEVIKALNKTDDESHFYDTLPDIVDRDSKKINRSLGYALSKRTGVRYTNGLMVSKGGVKKHAVTWQVVSYRVNSKPDLASKGELGELPATPRSDVQQQDNTEVSLDSPNSQVASKNGELGKTNSEQEELEF
jgi:hypothetical protein